MGRPDYSIVTRHRWLWPPVDIAAALLYTLREIALKHEARQEARHSPTLPHNATRSRKR